MAAKGVPDYNRLKCIFIKGADIQNCPVLLHSMAGFINYCYLNIVLKNIFEHRD